MIRGMVILSGIIFFLRSERAKISPKNNIKKTLSKLI